MAWGGRGRAPKYHARIGAPHPACEQAGAVCPTILFSMNHIFLIAHAPLAHALRQCALHVFPDSGERVLALDVQPNESPEVTLESARILLEHVHGSRGVLVLTDVFGATPSNVVQTLVQEPGEDGLELRALAGVNLPMLLRAVTYAALPLPDMLERAMSGGSQGIMTVGRVPRQDQKREPPDDSAIHHHQQ